MAPNPLCAGQWLSFSSALEDCTVCQAEQLEVGQLKCPIGKMQDMNH